MRAGGGANHRGSLSDGILVKDNHLAGLTIEAALAEAQHRWPGHAVEVECDTLDQVKEAVEAGADLILVDNMDPPRWPPPSARRRPRARRGLRRRHARHGGRPTRRRAPTSISVGALTHSAPVLDIGLDLER